jgi:hypothetical protein
MSMREVRVYDRDPPANEQIRAGDPDAVFPKEIWLQQVQPGEFAVRYKDFKTGLARNPAGELAGWSAICRIFSDLGEARADSRKVVNEHWMVRCFIYDDTGEEVAAISNNKQLNKYAAAMYAGILFWVGFCTVTGMGLLWLLYRSALLIAGPSSIDKASSASEWFYWMSYAFAGLLAVMLVWYLRLRSIAGTTVSRMKRKLKSAISPEDRRRFEELNTLYGSKDRAERERFLKLSDEYQEKVREALKK